MGLGLLLDFLLFLGLLSVFLLSLGLLSLGLLSLGLLSVFLLSLGDFFLSSLGLSSFLDFSWDFDSDVLVVRGEGFFLVDLLSEAEVALGFFSSFGESFFGEGLGFFSSEGESVLRLERVRDLVVERLRDREVERDRFGLSDLDLSESDMTILYNYEKWKRRLFCITGNWAFIWKALQEWSLGAIYLVVPGEGAWFLVLDESESFSLGLIFPQW